MKILYLANLRLPTEKAYGIQIIKTCEAMASNGADVSLVYPYRRNRLIKEGISEYYGLRNKIEIKRIIVPDLFIPGILEQVSFHINNLVSGLALAIYGVFRRSDFIYSRDELPLFILSFVKKNLVFEVHKLSEARRHFYRRFKSFKGLRFVVISGALEKELVKLGISPSRILVAPDGFDPEIFSINEIDKSSARLKTGLPDGNIIMYTGHLFEWKGAHVLAESAQLLPQFNFVFVGGTDTDVKNFKNKFGHLKNVLILGHKKHAEMPFYLKAADILVIPNSGREDISRMYTSPLKLFEYMASNRPIIASDLPSIREILNAETAIFFRPDDPRSLADSIIDLYNKPDLAKSIGGNALKTVQEYTWQKRALKILKFIESV